MVRVLISTDLGGYDNDDAQSMIHALLYANDVDYRGFVMTRTLDGGSVGGRRTSGATMLREMLDAYEDDLPNLRQHDSSYPSAASLRSKIFEGSYDGGWPGTLSRGAQHIVSQARAASEGDPLYILAWGPIHDVAAALLSAPDIVPKVRLYSLAAYGQDSANPAAYNALVNAVRNNPDYDDLWWINAESTMRGIYVDQNGDRHRGIANNLPWVQENIAGHGELGKLFREKYTYDLSTSRSGASSPDGLKMGDTPSLLYLLDNANNNAPTTANSWGGRFRDWDIGDNTYTDRTEASLRMGNWDGARTVYNNRPEIYDDFAERMDWAAGNGGGGNGGGGNGGGTGGGDDGGTGGGTGGGNGNLPGIGTGRTEAESLSLDGYRVAPSRQGSSQLVETYASSGGDGTAEGTFTGATGNYQVSVRYFDENDGRSTFNLYVDGQRAASWQADDNDNAFHTETRTVRIERGDTITVEGNQHSGEWARWDNLTIQSGTGQSGSGQSGTGSSSGGTSGGGSSSGGSGSGATIGIGRTQAESLDLDGYRAVTRGSVELVETYRSGGGQGTAEGTFTGPTGTYAVSVRYFDENDGNSTFRLFVDDELVSSWTASGNQDSYATATDTVRIEQGDTIRIEGNQHSGEWARWDHLTVQSTSAMAAADTFDLI
ncbi:nucleoside hydrolase-like domain-containing protein [Amaricoccus sp. W119]|uniref:nucleoside hydrolase-like domain-containing protein n=1 Tax=Amaricoccus sp. W119 TaxID=3391833 RepID=UPI0039A6279D